MIAWAPKKYLKLDAAIWFNWKSCDCELLADSVSESVFQTAPLWLNSLSYKRKLASKNSHGM